MKTRIPLGVFRQIFLSLSVLLSLALSGDVRAADSIVISEIMYHPGHALNTPENLKQEWIELLNPGTQAVDLTGWRFSDGVEFVFPSVSIRAGKYLVVAADMNTFRAKHPGVTNAVGGWIGGLSNSGERLQLADAVGAVVNTVRYADQGDWGVRSLGPAQQGHRGWEWSSAADGTGKSLELINASLPNDCGQNWVPSVMDGGTPGAANSVAAGDIAPMIADVQHWPMIPTSAEAVTVTARIVDEQTTGLAVTLHYRVDSSTYTDQNTYPKFNADDYLAMPMADDGAHGDGRSGDGVYGATIPAQTNAKIVEFYVEARDAGGKTRTWPAPAMMDGVPQQVTNALYQVDNSFSPAWTPGSQPVYYLIMTEMERGRLAYIGTHSTMQGPDSQMNMTFISVDGTGMEVRHNASVRNRGHGTRNMQPNQCHVNFPHDRPWKGVTEMNLNTNYTYVEVTACAVFQMAGLAQSDAHPVKVRINGKDLSSASTLRTSGSYDRIEAVNGDWAKHHFPDDPDGNAYKCMRSDSPSQPADLHYLGTNPTSYQICYTKTSNSGENDWSDLIELTRVLSDATTSDSVYAEQVQRVLNVEQWLRFIAVNILADNGESSLAIGVGDEYFMYRGVEDRRFVLIQHDLEAMFGLGDERAPSATHGIWQATSLASMNRFLKHPQFAPRYFWHLTNLIETTFSARQFDPLVDYLLGDWVPAARIATMKKFVADRDAYVLSIIPQKITVTNPPASAGGYPRVAANAVSLTGQANAIDTRRVAVNGQPATWTAWQGTWSINNVRVLPGINRVVIQAFDAADREIERSSLDIWSDNRPMVAKAGGSLGADEVWATAGGPYHVTGNITVPAGRTLTIEPGTTVFLDADCGFIVHGRLVAKGTEYQRIRFTRVPGTTTQWAGFQFPDTKEDNIIAYADLEFGGARPQWITTGNNNAGAAGPTARLTVDHATFRGSDTQYFSIWDPQIVIRNSVFVDLGNHYMCMAERMPADGWFLIEGNLFGHTHGDTDILHLNFVSVKGGPVARILDNVFTGGGDDLVDDNETDTYFEGNLFMHANVGNTGRSASAAVTTGPGDGSASANNLDTQQLTIVRNIFYHNDYAILCKTGASALIYANVFLQNAGALLFDETARTDSGPRHAAYIDNCIFWKSGPEVDGTATDNGTGTFVNRRNTQVVVNNSLVPSQFSNLGTGNVEADPIFVDADRDVHVDANLPCFSTGFPGFADGGYLLKGLIPDVHLRPESPARGTGANGVDMGAMIPPGASIAGEPLPVTWRTSATLTVGGPDLQAYKYRLNSGPWSTEVVRPVAGSSVAPTPLPPIALTNLQNGQACKVSVIGKDATGLWQDESSPAVSRTWGIDTSYKRLVLNEVLAVNKSILKHDNTFPDLVELYYDGPAVLSLSGMSLSDDPAQPDMFVFPSGVTMNPGTYLVLYADSGASGTGLHLGFALNADGDAVYLYDKTGVLLDSVVFGHQVPDVSIGRIGPLGQWHLTVPVRHHHDTFPWVNGT
ncbi:MAG: lamin tail domain-containing protein [Planctomycetes bacterium]|nr:lamin tail domain-containing protein [Planctomycetota bacterium]